MGIDWSLLSERIGPVLPALIGIAGLSLLCALTLSTKWMRLLVWQERPVVWEGMVMEWSSGLAQLLGLCGTCLGMLGALANLKTGDPSSIRFLIAGMSHFLWSTATGLIISIFCSTLAFAAESIMTLRRGEHDDTEGKAERSDGLD